MNNLTWELMLPYLAIVIPFLLIGPVLLMAIFDASCDEGFWHTYVRVLSALVVVILAVIIIAGMVQLFTWGVMNV